MKKVKAFTLIEVIVSIAIIGILAVGMLPVMSGGLMFLNRSKDITQNIFDAQKEMEFAIESIKANPDGMTQKTIKVFDGYDVEVTYYEVSKEKNGRKYTTLVSETRPLKYNMLSLTGAKAVANNNVNLKVVEGSSANKIEARHDAITDSEYFKTSYQWYKSRKGFNIPIPESGVSEVEIGTIYPVFPDDYEPLPLNFDTTLINDLTAFAGRHVIFTAEPVSIYGKFGQKSISNTIYVAETIFSDELLVHLDASLIDETDSGQVNGSGNNSFVYNWLNQSNLSYNAAIGINNNNRQPIVITNLPNIDFVGKYVAFREDPNNNSNNQRLIISDYDEIFNKTLDLFMVVRGNDNNVIRHGGQQINVIDSRPNNGNNQNDAQITQLGNGWKIAKYNNYSTNKQNNSNFRIGNSDIDVAELLVYADLSTDDEAEVIAFLQYKYQVFVQNGEVSKLNDLSVELYRDESYSLPGSILATFVDDNSGYVPVTWNSSLNAPGGVVDTSQVGTLNFEGYATSDSTKTVTLTVTVKPITELTSVSINSITQPLEVDDTTTMSFSFSPMNATIQTIKWTSSNTDVVTINQTTGELEAVSNGKSLITVEANGVSSITYEVVVGNIQPISNGLVLHLDASDAMTVESNGGKVAEWRDKSGDNNHFVQNSNNNRPSYSNGIIQFNPNPKQYLIGNSNLSGLEFLTNSGGNFTVFVVGNSSSPDNGWSTYLSHYMTTKTAFLFGRNTSGEIEANGNNSVYRLRANTNNSLNYYSLQNSGGSVSLWINGAFSKTLAFSNSNEEGGHIYIGAGYNGTSNYLDGSIAEIIVYDRVLTSTERTQIEAYLKSKWID